MIYRLGLLLILLLLPVSVLAAANNKVGIHLAQPHLNDLQSIKELVNSSGGDWGYVTVIIQENDRNIKKWQEIFDLLREKHLIPIVRLATEPEGEVWRRPKKEEAENWANFLASLNWVVKNRYLVLFNEPNHGSEWGGEVDAEDYAQVAFEFIKKLKEKNPDFFVMLAGLDASAPQSPPVFEDEKLFLEKALLSPLGDSSSDGRSNCLNLIECINNDLINGWSSHSYPNPGFSGSPWDQGRGTIRTYLWELSLLKSLGVAKDLPVFITETGWSADKLSRETIAQNFRLAYENVWLPDGRVMAVTPFVFDYQGPPFLGFSWKLPSSIVSDQEIFFPQYFSVQSITKVKGEPEQEEKGIIIADFPKEIVAHSNYHLTFKIKNFGQGFWDKEAGYTLQLTDFPYDRYIISDLNKLKPFDETEVDLYFKTNGNLGKKAAKIALFKNKEKILESRPWLLEIFPLPSLKIKVNLYPKLTTEGEDFEIQIFDQKEEMVFRKKNVKIQKSFGEIKDIQNIAFGKKYRVVILKPYYLPRQAFITFQKKEANQVRFEKMIPLDFNQDGKWSGSDIITFFKNPRFINLFYP
ncbi:MAG: hypothetical protein QHH09_00570 [Microgenomates group bacterium]|nr:hypothetical protein [Microgenomates group bacterium]